jgi:hypothetical protein
MYAQIPGHERDIDKSESFSSRNRGQVPLPIDATLARINADVYEANAHSIDGWSPLGDQELQRVGIDPVLLANERSGFRSRIYTDHQGHYVLAFCGSNEAKDWLHNTRQGIGLEDSQYRQGVQLSLAAKKAFGDNLVLTGHSLGGGLATAGSLVTSAPAVTFNSAGLHNDTIDSLGMNPEKVRQAMEHNGQIRRYAIDHEILTTLQEKALLTRGLLPDAIGHKIELPDPHPLHGWQKLVPGNSLRHGFHLHGMDAVIEAQQLAAYGSVADPAHPQHRLFNDAFNGLKGIDRETLGFRSEDEYRNAAGSLVVKAQQGGLHRIDHVVAGANGTLFAVEGPLESAGHRIVGIDKGQAASQSIEASSQQLQSPAEAPAQPMQPERQRHAVALP